MRSHRWWIWIILCFSYVLRVYLCSHGGQYYWPDESRYNETRDAVYFLFHPAAGSAGGELLRHADHWFFRFICIPPALYEEAVGNSPRVAACYFAAFSVLAIGLIYRVAKAAGASEREALFAAFFASASSTLLMYARHFFPYDAALCFLLAALLVNFGQVRIKTSFLVGVVASLGFLTYNGYWLLAGIILTLHCTLGTRSLKEVFIRGVAAGLGLLAPIISAILLARFWHYDLVALGREFSGTIVQGDFHIGGRILAEYLWSADRIILPVLVVGTLAGLTSGFRRGENNRFVWWISITVALAGGLVVFSDVAPKFVVYGRLARCLVPFLCLSAAFAFDRYSRGTVGRLLVSAVALVVIVSAAFNFSPIAAQIFPIEFRALAKQEIHARKRDPLDRYRVVHAEHLWGALITTRAPVGDTVFRRSHPLQYRPYQYEGFSAEQRRLFGENDISMRVIRLDREPGSADAIAVRDPLWDVYPGPISLKILLPSNKLSASEPLVTTGEEPQADFLYLKYEDANHVRIGFDHWGSGGPLSAPIALDYSIPHELLISMGSLLPPRAADVYRRYPTAAHLRSQLIVFLDGKEVFSQPQEFHPTEVAGLSLLNNYVGGTTAASDFTGKFLSVSRLGIDKLQELFPPLINLSGLRDGSWEGALGPLAFSLDVGTLNIGTAQPLVALKNSAGNEMLFVRRNADQTLQFGYEQAGASAVVSDPIAVETAGKHRITFSTGSLLPRAESRAASENHLERLRELLFVGFDDRSIFVVKQAPKPPAQTVQFGLNSIGSTAAVTYLRGRISDFVPVDPAKILSASVELVGMTGAPSEEWDGYPGPILLVVRFRLGEAGRTEPLLVSGSPGAGDFLYVRYVAPDRIRFGFDHWGLGGAESEPITIDPNRDYRLTVTMGALMPPLTSELYRRAPGDVLLRSIVRVELDGVGMFSLPIECHPSPKERLTLGVNFIGGSSAGSSFSGRIAAVKRVPAEQILPRVRADYFSSVTSTDPIWQGFPGPLKLNAIFAEKPAGTREAVLTTGKNGEGDVFFVEYEGNGLVRLGWDHWGAIATLSDPILITLDHPHELAFSFAGLFPPGDAPLYHDRPDLASLRTRTVVLFDGKPVLSRPVTSFTSGRDQIAVGANFIGGSVATLPFTGRISQVERADISVFLTP